MRRLPLLTERSIAEARVLRTELAGNYEVQLRSRLASEGTEITCKKGCHHCCYQPVFLSLLEGTALYTWLSDRGLWPSLRESFLQTSSKTWDLAPEVWSLSLIPCPLLDNGLCMAYEARPFVCRVTYSVGDPEECHPHRLGPGRLPKKELLELVMAAETPLLRRHYLGHFQLPLATAVLYGEKISKGEIELESCTKALWQEPPNV